MPQQALNGSGPARPEPTDRRRDPERIDTGEVTYKSLRVTAEAKQKLDLIAASLQKPLIRLIEEMADEWWAWVVEEQKLPGK